MANSIGNLIREIGDLALDQMNREQLEAVAMFDVHSEEFAPNLADLAEGLGCLIAQDAQDADEGRISSGVLQGTRAIAAFAAIRESVDIIAAVGYITNYATSKLLQPKTYGGPVEGKSPG